MKNLFRLGSLASLAMASVFASALTLHFQTEGTFNQTGSTLTRHATSVTLEDGTVTNASLIDLSYEFTKGAGIGSIPGSYTLENGTGTLSLTTGTVNFSLATGFGAPISGPAGMLFTSNQAGIINFSGGTGIFAGLNGVGVLSFNTVANSSDPNNGTGTTNFDATFEAVPEPASMAILGMGALGFLAKRRRK